MIQPLREQLRNLANDCEERARRSSCRPDARGMYHRTARDARDAAGMRHLDHSELQAALDAALAFTRFAACLNGDALPEAPEHALAREGARLVTRDAQTVIAAPSVPDSAVNARQLSARFGVPERTARRTIARLACQGVPGFYSIANGERTRWLADPDAFARAWP